MGGKVRPAPAGFPDWGAEYDFNVQADVESARLVLGACEPTLTTLVPIEVTAQTALRRSDLAALRRSGPLGRLLADQANAFAEDQKLDETYGRVNSGLPDDLVNFQHDPLACAVAVGWDGVTIETIPLAPVVEDGWLHLRSKANGRPFRVVTAVDTARFADYWLHALTSDARTASDAEGAPRWQGPPR